jgi:hypothetical protein
LLSAPSNQLPIVPFRCVSHINSPLLSTTALPSAEVSLSHDKYESGDFVFLDQYVKAPGHFLEGFGSESDTNMFHGGTIFCDAASTFMFITHIFGCQ